MVNLPPETRARFRSLGEFNAFRAANRWVADADAIAAILAAGKAAGIRSTMLGPIPPERIVLGGQNYREQFLADGFSPRQRCVLDLVAERFAAPETRMHVHEAVTPLALLLRGRYAYAHCTEYLPTAAIQAACFPVPHADITASPFPDGVFDLIVSNEVLEHVPDLDAALRDMARILRPAGELIATLPFAYASENGIRRATRNENGEVIHRMPPEYHGNPIDPQGGSLVFEVPGWDVLQRAKAAGFRDAAMLFDSSSARGITATELAGILVLTAQR